MGKIKSFDLVFSNESATFYAGQQVAGKVVLEVTEEIKFRAIKLRFIGEAVVSFPDITTKKNQSDRVQYFDGCDIIFGNPAAGAGDTKEKSALPSGENPTLQAGKHEFPFAFSVPTDVPSSFESIYGRVRYWCKVYLHRPWKFDITSKKPFSIVSVVDLNSEPLAFTPGYGKSEHRFSLRDKLLSCVKGGLSVELNVRRCAYVSGESILIGAEVLNNSSERVKSVEAFVSQNVSFMTRNGAARMVPGIERLGLIEHGPMRRGEADIWREEPLKLPALPPSRLGSCKLISVDYFLRTPGYGKSEHRFSLRDKLLSCVKGGLSVELNVRRCAYVSGESILIGAEVLNNSSERVKSVEAFVSQNVSFMTRNGAARMVPGIERLGLIEHGPMRRGEADIWREEPLKLPALPPSRLGSCKLISVDYFLRFVVVLVSGKNILLNVPIVIGTIPLHQQPLAWLPEGVTTPRPPFENQPSAPPLEDMLGAPPSYEECTTMETANVGEEGDTAENSYGQTMYRPRYPLYPSLPNM